MSDIWPDNETADGILERVETYARRARVICAGMKTVFLVELNESQREQYIETMQLLGDAYEKLNRLYGEKMLEQIDEIANRLNKEFGI